MKAAIASTVLIMGLVGCQNSTGSEVKDDPTDPAEETLSLNTGSFSMFSDRNHEPSGCDIGVSLILDKAEIMGNIAVTQHFVDGFCEIFVAPNTALFDISNIENDGCGSRIYSGSAFTNDGIVDLEVTDNRSRMCDDIIPSLVVMKLGDETYYSYDDRDAE